MRKQEKYMLGIYLELQEIQKEKGLVALTGSLLLAFKGIEKRRAAKDIDVISHDPEAVTLNSNFRDICIEGGSETHCRRIEHIPTGTKIDILYSLEEVSKSIKYHLEVWVGSVEKMYEAKKRYGKCDITKESMDKHNEDLYYLDVIERPSTIAERIAIQRGEKKIGEVKPVPKDEVVVVKKKRREKDHRELTTKDSLGMRILEEEIVKVPKM